MQSAMVDAVADLLAFIDRSPTPYHAVAEASRRLREASFQQLGEGNAWDLSPGDRRYVVRGRTPVDNLPSGDVPLDDRTKPAMAQLQLDDAPPGGGDRLASRGELDGVGEVRLEDDWSGIRLAFQLEPACGFWRFPIETVSQSEDGFERNYQASSLLFHWRLSLEPGASEQIVVRTTASHMD